MAASEICVDLTPLNKNVLRETYPLPRQEDTLVSLEGFWQVRLAERSTKYRTFITPFGRYQYLNMPFGISAGPEFIQRQINKILEGLDGLVSMMDDILVVGKTREDYDNLLEEVLKRILGAGMTLNKEKCECGVQKVKFLGHILDVNGIVVDPDKEIAIREMTAPQDHKALQRFPAMVNYLSRFSPLLAEAEVPLRELDNKKNDWWWGEIQQKSFDRVKDLITSSPLLALFDYNRRHRVTADSS